MTRTYMSVLTDTHTQKKHVLIVLYICTHASTSVHTHTQKHTHLKCDEGEPAMGAVTFAHDFDVRHWPERLCKMRS